MEESSAEKSVVPHAEYLNKAEKVSKIWMFSFFGSMLFSIVKDINLNSDSNIVIITSILLIVFLYSTDKYIQYLKDTGEGIRRKGLLDNSFGTKFYTDESKGYYNNTDMNNDTEKLLANVHESAFYTQEILKSMLFKQVIFVVLWVSLLVVLSTIGLNNFSFSLNILDFFLSYVLIDKLLEMFSLKRVAEKTTDEACSYWSRKESDYMYNEKSIAEILNITLDYETSISSVKFILNSKIKDRLNDALTKRWGEIRKRYNIK